MSAGTHDDLHRHLGQVAKTPLPPSLLVSTLNKLTTSSSNHPCIRELKTETVASAKTKIRSRLTKATLYER